MLRNYRNLWIAVPPVGLYPPPYFYVYLFRHVGELRACAIRRAQSLRLDDSCILIYDTSTKFMSHHHPSGIIVDVGGIKEPSRGRSCEVHDTCDDIVAVDTVVRFRAVQLLRRRSTRRGGCLYPPPPQNDEHLGGTAIRKLW